MRARAIFLALALAGCESGAMLPPGSEMQDDMRAPREGNPDGSVGDGAAAMVDLLAPSTDMPFTPATHPALPTIPTSGGAVLSPMTVVTIVAPTDAIATQFGQFADALPASSWWSTLKAEYGLTTITHTQVVGPSLTSYLQTCANTCTSNCSSCMTSTHMKSYITAATSGQTYSVGHTMYLLILPSTVTGIFDNALGFNPSEQNDDCNVFTGYHSYLPKNVGGQSVNDGWGFVQNCFGFDDVTTIASHEIFEAATDTNLAYALQGANANTPWSDSIWASYEGGANVELADICEGTQYLEGGFVYQRVWSNAAAAAGGDPCIPASSPFNNVSVPQGWYSIAAGKTINVPVTGWSTGPMSSWVVDAPTTLYGGFTAALTGAAHTTVAGKSYVAINNGGTANLAITAPANATSGEWITLTLSSYLLDWTGPNGTTPDSEDFYHYWPVGFYVP